MPSIAQLSKTIVVVGNVQAIHEDLRKMAKRHTIKVSARSCLPDLCVILIHPLAQYIRNTHRQQLIKDMKRVAAEGRVDILFFMDGSLKSSPINEEVFGPFLPHLSFVSGIGAGFDHSAYRLPRPVPRLNADDIFPLSVTFSAEQWTWIC